MQRVNCIPSAACIKLSITVVESCSGVAFWEQSRILGFEIAFLLELSPDCLWRCPYVSGDAPMSLEMPLGLLEVPLGLLEVSLGLLEVPLSL